VLQIEIYASGQQGKFPSSSAAMFNCDAWPSQSGQFG